MFMESLLLILVDSLLWGKNVDPAIAAFLMVVTVIHETNCSSAGE
jgi:hypothetical protein